MNYLIHATPVHPSLCLQSLILLFTIATITVFILLLLLLFCYYHHYKTVATDKPLRASLFPGAAELTTHLLRLINIIWLPLCRINKFRFYFPRRLLRSPILMGHQRPCWYQPRRACQSKGHAIDGASTCYYIDSATTNTHPTLHGECEANTGEDDQVG
jgi:hypothetical protein